LFEGRGRPTYVPHREHNYGEARPRHCGLCAAEAGPRDLARWYHRSGDYSGEPYCKACRGPGPRTPGG
jgi:hypothetical protein